MVTIDTLLQEWDEKTGYYSTMHHIMKCPVVDQLRALPKQELVLALLENVGQEESLQFWGSVALLSELTGVVPTVGINKITERMVGLDYEQIKKFWVDYHNNMVV